MIKAKGQSMVEMALLAPMFCLLLFGTIDLGRLIQAHTRVSNAAHLAMRDVQNVENTDATTGITIPAVQTAVAQNFPDINVGIQSTNPTTITSNEAVTVTAVYPFHMVTPFVRTMIGQYSITQTVTGTTLP